MTLEPFEWTRRWWEPLAGGLVFLRHDRRFHPDTQATLRCLTITNVELPEDRRDAGHFTKFLGDLEAAVAASDDIDAIYIENVYNDRLPAFFRLRGYRRVGQAYPPCFFWFP